MNWKNIVKSKFKGKICRMCGEYDETVSNYDQYHRQICTMCSEQKADEWYESEKRILRDE